MTMNEAKEQAIDALVREFYALANADPVLGPYFAATITDWDTHHRIVVDFWSHALLGTARYKGSPFPVHMNKGIEPEMFDLWLACFEKATAKTLPPLEAEQAMARARHMTQSFTVGLFPYKTADGKPSRRPPGMGGTP
jgi:hemoglobin